MTEKEFIKLATENIMTKKEMRKLAWVYCKPGIITLSVIMLLLFSIHYYYEEKSKISEPHNGTEITITATPCIIEAVEE